MANTVTVDTKTINIILARLDSMAKDIRVLKEKLLEHEPPYGSNEWWEWSDKKALEDIKKGDYYQLKDKKDIEEFFNHIDDEDYVHSRFHRKSKKANS